MINKQKLWFLTLFSLILILSVYYITMPSELLTASNNNISTTKKTSDKKVSVSDVDILTSLEVEKDEERSSVAAEYNEILTSKNSSDEEKNNAYEGLKEMDKIKSKEEAIQSKIKKNLKLESFVKIDNSNVNITIKKKNHDYSLANNIMRLVKEEFDTKVYVSVKFES